MNKKIIILIIILFTIFGIKQETYTFNNQREFQNTSTQQGITLFGIDNYDFKKPIEDEIIIEEETITIESVEQIIEPTPFIPVGKSVYIQNNLIEIPESIPKNNLDDYTHSIINQILYTVKYSENYSEIIIFLGDLDYGMEIFDHINNILGFEFVFNVIAECNENGVCYAGSELNTHCMIDFSPLRTKQPINKLNSINNMLVNALYDAGVYNGMCERDAINRIGNWICNKMIYQIINDWNEYAGFEIGIGQCYHYAKMFELMCQKIGINCVYIEGYANGEYHAWNYVIIDGQTFWFDITWNDTSGTTSWSWLSEEQMRKDHYW